MTAGLARGLDNADAARFGFLLATPPILAAGHLKFSDLTGPNGAGIRGAAVIAAVFAAITAVITVHFLTRYFKNGQPAPVRDLLHRLRHLHGARSRRSPARRRRLSRRGGRRGGRPASAEADLAVGSRPRLGAVDEVQPLGRRAKQAGDAARSRAFSERRSSRPCLASRPKSTVAAMS